MTAWLWLLTLTLALGCALVGSSLPWVRRIPLNARVDPYVTTHSAGAPDLLDGRPGDPWSTVIVLTRPLVRDVVRILDQLLGGSASVRQRIARLGTDLTVERFRLEQLGWGLVCAAAALLFGLRKVAHGDWSAVLPLLLLVAVGLAGGVLLRDRWLGHCVDRRMKQLTTELPTVVELLALSVSAGEGLIAALERVSRVGNGAFVNELTRVLNDIRSGTPTPDALTTLSKRIDTNEIRRFVDAVLVAVERGTPLVAVLNAQVSDARESARRQLIESGGRKEIAMMIPVVFLVLPLSVVFALFPGFYGFSLGSS